MGLKKYEIITVGSDKRVRALRSWQVGDRYVNIGDVGGIVYDEKTLSQDGACWLFRGNFGFPGARIGGDSIVDVGETTLGAAGTPNVDILGSSVVVSGPKLRLEPDSTAADAVVLRTADFEPGMLNYAAGSGWETWKRPSPNFLRTKAPIFMGGVSATLKLGVPGYAVQAYVLDRDGKGVTATAATDTGVGVTLAIPAGQYFMLTLVKTPMAPIALSDVTAAKITFTGTYETKLSIIDSRVEINPATSSSTVFVKPGSSYAMAPGAKYPEYIIRNSKVSISVLAATNRSIRLLGQIIESTALLDATENLTMVGTYRNVNNLTASGVLTTDTGVRAYNIIQATDCDNFVVSPTTFPGLKAAQTANMPFIFQGCNVPGGRFYHHAQINNTYVNIDFAKAQADLGKAIASGEILVSSEVEGMYRLYSTTGSLFGALVEAHDSVKSLNMTGGAATYGTTIYKDAYVSGKFDFAGTNVFGNTKKHDTQDVSGCKIVNTGETAVNMKGNIRVEDNATLVNASVTGSGYFGGNAVASGLLVNGCAYMRDNASFTKTAGSTTIRDLKMTENAYAVIGDFSLNGRIHLSDNARFIPRSAELFEGDLIMKDNAAVSGNAAVIIGGVTTMKDNARVSGGTVALSAYGDITLCGSYDQTANKIWTGKRVIDSQDAPTYDDNVKTKYDF